ncbi:sulfite exporter TauE/SafE family protein [Vagococcus sp. JNUCC 83]
MIGWVYFFIIIFANSIGAISGMGGGVIIKPLFDMLGYHDVLSISFYSTVAVLSMSLVSTARQVQNGIKISWPFALSLSLGSVLGGILGSLGLDKLVSIMPSEKIVSLIQIILIVSTLIFSYAYSKSQWKSYHFKSLLSIILCGVFLGAIASFLGIGGGPLNVALLMMLFSVPIKDATVYSIITILFSQLSKIITIQLSTDFSHFDLSLLVYIIPAGMIGGLLGAYLSKKVSSEKVTMIYQFVILAVLLVNFYNAYKLFL